MMYWDDGRGDGGWMAVFMILSALTVLAVIGFLAWWSLHSASAGRAVPSSGPEQVLAERLARGDIDVSEYRQRLEALRSVDARR